MASSKKYGGQAWLIAHSIKRLANRKRRFITSKRCVKEKYGEDKERECD
ncbi:MAG: hypothetical protein KAJ14_05815 [Candidatus Omnitrophica bacterium]|nr:hypothetical protein [Candidatus Omnitrophota bacterium]